MAFDQRFVRRVEHGFTALGTTIPLCQSCGRRDSCALSGSIIRGVSCGMFKPVISFVDSRGLISRQFNTFRRGLGAFRRMEEGTSVSLYSNADGMIIGEGVVKTRYGASLGELLPDHAQHNHLMLDTPSATAPERLHSILRRLYGKNYSANHADFSVVYVEPVLANSI